MNIIMTIIAVFTYQFIWGFTIGVIIVLLLHFMG